MQEAALAIGLVNVGSFIVPSSASAGRWLRAIVHESATRGSELMKSTASGEQMGEILAALELEPLSENVYRAPLVAPGSGNLFGGQMLAQAIVAAGQDNPTKRVSPFRSCSRAHR